MNGMNLKHIKSPLQPFGAEVTNKLHFTSAYILLLDDSFKGFIDKRSGGNCH